MNKYSSKAIKTATTVGMSLAMVLSAATPVLAVQEAGVCATATKDSAGCGLDIYVKIVDLLESEGISFSDVQFNGGLTIRVDNNGTDDSSTDDVLDVIKVVSTYRSALAAYRLSNGDASTLRTINGWFTTIDEISDMMGVGFIDLVENSEISAVESLDGEIQGYAEKVASNGNGWLDNDGNVTTGNVAAARTALREMNTFENRYYDNMSDVMQSYFSSVKTNIEVALGSNTVTSDEELAAFVEAFDKVLQNDLDGDPTTLTATEHAITGLGTDNGEDGYTVSAVNLSSRSALRARITRIQNADLYDDFADEDSVVALIDAYQQLIDNLGDVSTVLTSDSYVAYTRTRVGSQTVRNFVMTNAPTRFDSINNSAAALSEVEEIAETLKSSQWEILEALKSDVLDLIFNFSTRQIGSYYTDRGAFVDNATASQITTIKNNVPGALLKVVDNETGEFGIDYLAAYMADVADALTAVTTDIEALTPANITAADKALLEAAEDALFDLQDTYKDNLTSAEKREVSRAESKITNLREAFDNLGTTNVAGWYSMGNGNWGYNNEDGTPAAYKWVASGSDWYMIRNGVMLRNTWIATDGGRWYYVDNAGKMVTNQSVDGCWINSYGVYMSPSYNG